MGESKFKLLCASAGIICNSSKDDDQAGWDFFLDFPDESHLAIFADMSSQPISCKVQVKSTDNIKKQVQISLSNLLRFAKESIPVFIFFLEFHGNDEPQDAYLVHVDSLMISSILKKVRMADVGNKKLNKTFLSIKYNDYHKLSLITGKCLSDEIKKHIPMGMPSYITQKQNLFKTLGFENGAVEFKFKTNTEESFLKLTKALLGDSSFIDITEPEFHHMRFDIKTSFPRINADIAKLQIHRVEANQKALMTVLDSKNNKRLNYDCDLFITPYDLSLGFPNGAYIARLACSYFDFFLKNNGSMECKFKLHNKVLHINELKKAIELVNLICFDNNELDIKIKSSEFQNPLEAKINTRGKLNGMEKNAWVDARIIVNGIVKIINTLDLDIPLRMSIHHFHGIQNKINTIIRLLDSNPKGIEINFQLNEGDFFNDSKSNCFLTLIALNVGDFTIISLHALIGVVFLADDNYKFTAEKAICEGGMYYEKHENPEREIMLKTSELNMKYKKQGYNVFSFTI